MKQELLREITPLTSNDCFTLFSRTKTEFDFPLHYHEEYELNLILNAAGAKRIVGDHVEEIEGSELVLVGPNLPHAWFTHNCSSPRIQEVTIQFHKDLFDEKLLQRSQLSFIRTMFKKSVLGILFSSRTVAQVAPRITGLNQKQGFDSILELMSILHDLSISREMRILSSASAAPSAAPPYNSERIERIVEYVNKNFDRPVTLAEVARLANMSEVSFSRFFKQHTGITFIDSLIEIRLGHATRMLIETPESIAGIAYHCGFNNISNFNRIFRKKKKCTPTEFRESFSETRIFV